MNSGTLGRARRARRGLTFGAAVGAVALLASACGGSSTQAGSKGTHTGSSSGLYGHLPAVGTPKTGGTITIGQIKGQTPLYAMPITPAADASVFGSYDFIDLMNQPVYWSPEGAAVKVDNALSFAQPPKFSDGNKTVTLDIKSGWKWSTGDPVTAQNIVEYIDVLKQAVKESAANFSNYTPGFFPDNVVSTSTPNATTLVMHLSKAYNPGYFYDDQLDLLSAFPKQWAVDSAGGAQLPYANPTDAKKIYDYLNKQAAKLGTFGTNPLWKISDGPMKLTSFNATNGDWTMVPNPDYGGPAHAKYSELQAVTFTSTQAEFNELQAGTLDMGNVDYSNLPEVSRISHTYSVFGLPDYGFQAAFINFKDKTGDWDNIASQLYVRQALSDLVDQPGDIKGIFKNAGAPDYGTIPASPPNPYAPKSASVTPYPYSPTAAAKLLASHGWKKGSDGVLACAKAGTASGDCGSGIPAGTKLAFNWQYGNSPAALGQQSTAFASVAHSIGIQVKLQQETFNDLITNDSDPSAPSKENTWAVSDFGGFTNSLYPTTNTLFNTGGSFNLGAYNSPEANKLIDASVYGGNPKAVSAEASYLSHNLPVIFTANPDNIWAVKKTIGGVNDTFLNMTQYVWTPQYWYLTK